jgi:hypothetical protein
MAAVRGRAGGIARHRLHAAGGRTATRRPTRRRACLDQERRRVASVALLQGSCRRRCVERGACVRARHCWLRVDRESRQRGGGAGRAGRPQVMDFHSRGSRRGKGPRHRCVRAESRARAWALRRRESPLRAACRSFRVGHRQRQPARILRRRIEDDGIRDRRAAGVAAADGGDRADGRRIACDQVAQGIRRIHSRRACARRVAEDVWSASLGVRADRATRRTRRRADHSRNSQYDRSIDRDRQSGRRAVRVEGDPVDWRLGCGGERSGTGRRHPFARRNHRHFHGNGGRCDGGGGTRARGIGPIQKERRDRPLYHREWTQDGRCHPGCAAQGTARECQGARGGGAGRRNART